MVKPKTSPEKVQPSNAELEKEKQRIREVSSRLFILGVKLLNLKCFCLGIFCVCISTRYICQAKQIRLLQIFICLFCTFSYSAQSFIYTILFMVQLKMVFFLDLSCCVSQLDACNSAILKLSIQSVHN